MNMSFRVARKIIFIVSFVCSQTATVLEVMKGLRAKVDKNELPPYRFVEINGLRLPSPDHAYSVSFF
jgi:Cdc6-like AAA superfamily ATPase